VDHESTPAQYMLRVQQKRRNPRNRQEVARYLVSRGCRTDILFLQQFTGLLAPWLSRGA